MSLGGGKGKSGSVHVNFWSYLHFCLLDAVIYHHDTTSYLGVSDLPNHQSLTHQYFGIRLIATPTGITKRTT